MRTRSLGRTELQVSEIAFGGIPIMIRDEEVARAVLRRALELGINYFDTARGYGDSEVKMGQALAGEQCYVASKSSTRNAKGVLEDVETSLGNLQRECIDVYQMHFVCTRDDMEQVLGPGGALEGLQQARRDGKIRFTGVSGHNRPVLVDTVRQAGDAIDVVQMLFNPLETDALDELIPLCAEKRIGIVAMKAIGGGIFECPEASMKWILSHPEISCTDPGMGAIEEVEANARVGTEDPALTEADERALDELRAKLDKQYCRRCGDCMPCPKGIDIVGILVGDSMLMRMGQDLYDDRDYAGKLEMLNECFDCNECVPKCPAGLSIPELLPLAAARIKEVARA